MSIYPIYENPDDPSNINLEGYIAEWVDADSGCIMSIEVELSDSSLNIYAKDFIKDEASWFEFFHNSEDYADSDTDEAAKFCTEWLNKNFNKSNQKS